MAFPVYTIDDLVSVTGRDASSFSNTAFVTQALFQAQLLYRIGTNREDMPDDETSRDLAKYGILFMADAIYLSQPYAEQLASPFSSESIGSYSYSKAASAVAHGLPTGVSWFDMAINMTSLGRNTDLAFGGIEILELDAELGRGHLGLNKVLLNPRKKHEPDVAERETVPMYFPDQVPEDEWLPDPNNEGYLLYDDDEP